MKYGRIEAAAHKLNLFEAVSLDAAERMCGLEPLKVDHGVIEHVPGVGGIMIVVEEFGLFAPPLLTHYFAIGGRLYAGNALLYGYDEFGDTTDFDDPSLVQVRWFGSGYEVNAAITRGEISAPQLSLNGVVIWQWPEPQPDLEQLARRMVKR